MGPKSFSAVMVSKTTAQSERHIKFVNLLEIGGLQTTQDLLAGPVFNNLKLSSAQRLKSSRNHLGSIIIKKQKNSNITASHIGQRLRNN